MPHANQKDLARCNARSVSHMGQIRPLRCLVADARFAFESGKVARDQGETLARVPAI
jgi:hypothetical protein